MRACEFRESVDTYQRLCAITPNADGSLSVVAQGTALNPDNGFSFTMHGGPNTFKANGQLNSFNICRGPFEGTISRVLDQTRTSYEMRFNTHCKIVIR